MAGLKIASIVVVSCEYVDLHRGGLIVHGRLRITECTPGRLFRDDDFRIGNSRYLQGRGGKAQVGICCGVQVAVKDRPRHVWPFWGQCIDRNSLRFHQSDVTCQRFRENRVVGSAPTGAPAFERALVFYTRDSTNCSILRSLPTASIAPARHERRRAIRSRRTPPLDLYLPAPATPGKIRVLSKVRPKPPVV